VNDRLEIYYRKPKEVIIMDPVTANVVSALTAGAMEVVKPTAQQAVKDAYEGLKKLVLRKFGRQGTLEPALATLEGKPDSESRQAVLCEELATLGADKDQELAQEASKLLFLLSSPSQSNAGVGGLVGQLNAPGGKVIVTGGNIDTVNM
jgi:hypothetical protein